MATQISHLHALTVGVGLRSPHYHSALSETEYANLSLPDFVEVHAENFFSSGGATHHLLEKVRERFQLSLHGTGLGLGSYQGLSRSHLQKLNHLTARYSPSLISEHLAFSLVQLGSHSLHAGDLLPVEYNNNTLRTFEQHINQTQDALGRQLLIENISSYFPKSLQASNSAFQLFHEYSETEFLTELCQRTGCGLLVDLNNLVVSAVNHQESHVQDSISHWLSQIPAGSVGEYHLAGCSPVQPGELMIDDHSTAVTPDVWQAYESALRIIGPRPTLLEWDTDLPEWDVLVAEVQKIREFAQRVKADNP